MNTTDKTEKALDKMSKLLVRSIDASSTENERAVALRALQNLSEKYNIDISEAEQGHQPTLADISEYELELNLTGRRETKKETLAVAASEIFGAKVITKRRVRSGVKSFSVSFIGTKPQQESSYHLYKYLLAASEKAANEAYCKEIHGNKRSFKHSFSIGFAKSVYERSESISLTRIKETLNKKGLKVIKSLPEQYMDSLTVGEPKKITITNSSAFSDGVKFGKNANLGNSVNNISGALN